MVVRYHEDKGFASARAARVMKKSKELEKRRQAEIAHKETLLKDIETTKQLNLAVEQSHHQVKVKAKDFTCNMAIGHYLNPCHLN